MTPNFDVAAVAAHVLSRKQQIEAATMLKPIAIQAPSRAVFYADGYSMGVVTSLVGIPVVEGETWGLVYPLDIPAVGE